MSVDEEVLSSIQSEEKNSSEISDEQYYSEDNESSYYSEDREQAPYYSEETNVDEDSTQSNESYYSEEELICEEPANSSESHYFNDSESMTHADGSNYEESDSYEYDYSGGGSLQSPTDPIMSSSPICSEDNYYSSMPEDGGESSGVCSEYSAMDYISESATNPHLVLDVGDEYFDQGKYPYIEMVSVSAKGVTDYEKLNVNPSEPGRIYWDIQYATHAQLNGEDIDLLGSREIRYDDTNNEAVQIYQIIAWRGDSVEYISNRIINVHMDPDHFWGIEPEIELKPSFKFKKIKSQYFSTQVSFTGLLKGKVSARSGDVPVPLKWSDGFAAEFAQDFELGIGDWVTTGKLEFIHPIPIMKFENEKEEDKKDEKVLMEVSGAVELSNAWDEPGVKGKAAFELSLTPLKLVRKKGQAEGWEGNFGEVTIKGGGSWDFVERKIGDVIFSGTLGLSASVEFDIEWAAVTQQAISRFGSNLGIGSAGVIAGAVAGVVTSGTFLATAGLAMVVLGTAKFMEAADLGRFSRHILPDLIKSLKSGIESGVRGEEDRFNTVEIVDKKTARLAGVAAGTKVRIGLRTNGELIDPYSERERNFVDETLRRAELNMKFSLWKEKAKTYSAGTWFDNDHADARMQYNWWNAIMQDRSPKEYGGEYLKKWLSLRVGGTEGDVYEGLKKEGWYHGHW